MNWDQIEGNWKQIKGKVQQQWGKLTDDQVDQMQGNREMLTGKIQESLRNNQGRSRETGAAVQRSLQQ